MRIAIEALGIRRPGGGRAATLTLLKSLLLLDAQNDYLVYLEAPEPALAGLNPRARQRILPVHNRFLARVILQALLPVEIRRRRVDLIHFVKNQVVPGTGAAARALATVYDLTTLRYPRAFPLVDVLYWRYLLPRQLRQMDGLIALSESTASDLVAYYQLPREQIIVIPPGYDPFYRPAAPGQVLEARQRYGLPEGFFLHVGSLSSKKNLAMLLDAFLAFRRRSGFSGKLVLAGAKYPKGHDRKFARRLAQTDAREAVVLTGHVPRELLVGLYGGALAFLFPSLHEGFGIAPLEAMACGAPVIVHAAGAVREVVGDAGIVMESASDSYSWSQAIETVTADPALRARLRQAGLERAKLFTAEKTAHQTLQLYHHLSTTREI